MSVDLPTWTAFDPDALPDLPSMPPGRVVGVLASAGATEAGWATAVATELAGTWSRLGKRVVLADLGVTRPTLHAELGEANGEGVTDTVAFGASLTRVARPVEGEAFFLVPAGTVVADARVTLQTPRWAELCEGFCEAGVLFVMYVPADEPASAVTLSAATDVIVLADEHEDVTRIVAGLDVPVIGVLGLSGLDGSPEAGGAPVDTDAAVRDDLDLSEVRDAAGDPVDAVADPSPVPDRRTPRRAAKRSSGRLVPLLVILAVVIVAVLVAAWLGLVEIPGVTPKGVAGVESSTAVAPAHTLAPPISSAAAYSVTVGSYRDAGTARGRIAGLEKAARGTLFTMVPVEVDGSVVYRVLLGPAEDSAQAATLAGLVAGRVGGDASKWLVRSTPRAFQLGEADDLDGARRRVAELRGLEVPAYVLAVDLADGSTRYRVYAGAFADDAEAAWLERRLAAQGLSGTTLSDRIGRLPE